MYDAAMGSTLATSKNMYVFGTISGALSKLHPLSV
jgi:hypothetical protein